MYRYNYISECCSNNLSQKSLVEIVNNAIDTRSVDTIKKILTKLKELEILEYQEENTLSQLIFLQARADLETLQLNEEEWRKRKYHEQKKLNTIIHYINTKDTCRSQLLLDYFGEKISEECGACDVCINKKRNNT